MTHFIILDLEATCWENRNTQPNEIIEIGALAVNDQKEILGEFTRFVKPKVHPFLSDFCTQLTTITQDQVDEADHFPEVLSNFQNWILSFGDDYWLCSWGYYDKTQLIKDCQLHSLSTEWLQNHISLKHQYAQIKKLNRPVGMPGALKTEKIPLEGIHHRGIDDARNITQIFLKYFDQWKYA